LLCSSHVFIYTVLLSPFGQSGFLTGQSQHIDDDKTNKLLEEWSKFYPLETASNWLADDSQRPDQEVPAVVMVISSDVHMMFPSAYVMVVSNEKDGGKNLIELSIFSTSL
jgi:hypothetical protein